METLTKLDEAISRALALLQPVTETEEIATVEAQGRVLAQEVLCPEDVPGFARAAMDGYAVRARDTLTASRDHPVTLTVIGSVAMGQDPTTLPKVNKGQVLEISTGGPMPHDTDAVITLEETERTSSEYIKILTEVAPGTYVLAADSDFQRGEKVFNVGHRLRPVDIGALLAMGLLTVTAFRRVCVGIISTGDELVEAESAIRPGQVRQINSHILRELIAAHGALSVSYGIVPDDFERLKALLQRAVRECDLVLVSGGSSVGARDLTFSVLQELGEVFIHGLAIRPGKPTIFAIVEGKPVVGLPGNPVSCVIVCEKFVRPLLARQSRLRVLLPSHKLASAQLTHTVRSVKGREDFIAVRLRLDEERGALYAEPIPGHSNTISTLAKADGILCVPAELEEIPHGTRVWVELL